MVPDGDFFLEAGSKSLNRLGGESDLGDEENGAFAKSERCADRLEIDFGFAAPGYALNEVGAESIGIDRSADRCEANFLLVVESFWL